MTNVKIPKTDGTSSSVIRNWIFVICHLRSRSSRSGFTLIEMLVTIAIVAVLATTSFVFLGSYRSKQNLQKALDSIEAAVTATQKRSITQDGGKQWGVRFTASSTGSLYQIFSGASYSTSTVERTYGVKTGIQFSEPSTGNSFDALFAPITGVVSSKKIISLITNRGDGFVSDLIFNTSGKITKRNEYGLVGYWHFDEGASTTAYDASGMANNGTLTNGPIRLTGSSCVSGGCLSLDGIGSYVTAAPISLANFTVSAWVNPNGVQTGYAAVVSDVYPGKVNYTIGFDAGTTNIYGGIYNASWYKTASISLISNTWSHVVTTYDGVNLMLYINGQLKSSIPLTISASSSGTQLRIGRRWDLPDYVKGLIDEVRIYNRALSASEILNMYNDLK